MTACCPPKACDGEMAGTERAAPGSKAAILSHWKMSSEAGK